MGRKAINVADWPDPEVSNPPLSFSLFFSLFLCFSPLNRAHAYFASLAFVERFYLSLSLSLPFVFFPYFSFSFSLTVELVGNRGVNERDKQITGRRLIVVFTLCRDTRARSPGRAFKG